MASPEDLLAQRNKIEQQILKLETALGADESILDALSSSSDSDGDSDDSGHAGEAEVTEDLEAERQKIQREIEELEQTLGGNTALLDALSGSENATDSHIDSSDDTSDDDDDDDDLDLPQDVETCLQINLVYQEVLKEKLTELERLLNENRQKQKEMEAQLSGPVSTFPGLPHMKRFLGTFMKPYFKDKVTGLGPPANEESKEKSSHGTRPCDEMKIRRWEGWQKTLLINSVVADTMKRMLQPKLSKMDYLTAKMTNAKNVDKEELKKQIALLEKDIEDIRSMEKDQLYGNRLDDHDWDKIANIDFEGLREPDDLMRFWQNFLHPSINKSTWKPDEIEKLGAVAEEHAYCHWDEIAEALGTNRSAFMCFQTYQRYISKTFRKREWTKEEDKVLRHLVEKMRIGNFIPYTQMSYFMEGRDHGQLMYRWNNVLDPSIKKGPWSKKEDQLLRNAVEKYGLKDWSKIRLEVPGRTDAACRDRYLDCLRDDVKKGPWSDDEVELLEKLVQKYGVGKWAKIASEIPNRIDCQCLHKWKYMTRNNANQCVKRAQKPSGSSVSKRRRLTWKKIIEEEEEESDIESSSEDEDIKVEYMDSDCERKEENQLDVSSDDDVDPREEYIQPDMKEWLPVAKNEQLRSAEFVRTMLVRLLTEEERQSCGENSIVDRGAKHYNTQAQMPLRCTVLNHQGYPLKTYMGKTVPLDKWDLCNKKAMIKVSLSDVKHVLIGRSSSRTKGHTPKTKINMSSGKQKDTQSGGQQTSRMKSDATVKPKHTKKIKSLSCALLKAVFPWVGNVLMPVPFNEKKVREVDIARKRAADIPLRTTPVFLLFLRVLHIDTEGCRKVIEARDVPTIQPLPPKPLIGLKTVKALLTEKEGGKKRLPEGTQHRDPDQHPPNSQTKLTPCLSHQQMNQYATPASMLPQAVVFTQPNVQQAVCLSQPAGNGGLSLLHPGDQGISQTCLSVLQLAVPVEPGKLLQPAAPSTTSTSSQSTNVPPTVSSEESRTSKRKRKPTAKAQALKECVESKNSKKMEASNKAGGGNGMGVVILPQTTTWIITPTGLLPVTGIHLSPGVSIQNQNINKPAFIRNQNVCTVEPNTSTDVTSPSTGKTNVGNPPLSLVTNGSTTVSSPVTSTASVPIVTTNTTNVSTSVTASAGQLPTSEIQSNENQKLVQVPFQLPITVNQNGSPTLHNSVSPSKSSVKVGATGVPAGTSENSTPLSATPTNSVTSVSPSSAITNTPAGTPVGSYALNISGPVAQVASVIVLDNQKPHSVPQSPKSSGSPAASSALSVAGTDTSTMTSNATPQADPVNGLIVPIQHNLPVSVQIPPPVTKRAPRLVKLVTRRRTILPQMFVQQTTPHAKMQPGATTAPISNPSPSPSRSPGPSPSPSILPFDSNLMFFEHPIQVKNWMMGNDGISLPQLETKTPYLPPFVSSINTVVSLLKAKGSLLRRAARLLPEEQRTSSEEEAQVAAVRKLVVERFETNPAYLLLKARFLSCFTLPALLATIDPHKEHRMPVSATICSDEDEEEEEDEEVTMSCLNTEENEASAKQFCGMIKVDSQSSA